MVGKLESAVYICSKETKLTYYAFNPKCSNGLCPLIASCVCTSGQVAFYIGYLPATDD